MNKGIIELFESFFKENYNDDIFETQFKTYPDNNSLFVDYLKLEMFNPDLADLLIEKPEKVIPAAYSAIKNVDPLLKDDKLNIRFINVTNLVPFEGLNSKHVGYFVALNDVTIVDVEKPAPIIDTAVFECNGCMALHEVEQLSDNIMEPSLCSECGGRSFRFLQEESEVNERQIITVGAEGTSKLLTLFLYGEDCSHDKYCAGKHLSITGVLKIKESKKGFEYYFSCYSIEILDNEIEVFEESIEEKEYGDRGSPEYNSWRKEVVNRDKVCQCCGYDNKLQAHHIFGYGDNKELRVDPNNGITLCAFCHGKYHSAYGRDNANPKDLIDFIKRFGVR